MVEMDQWLRKRCLELLGWDCFSARKSPSLYGSSGKINSMFKDRIRRIRTPKGKYVPVSKRQEILKKNKGALTKMLLDIMDKRNYSIATGVGVDLGKNLTNEMKVLFANPEFDKSQFNQLEQRVNIEADFKRCADEFQSLVVFCQLNQCDNAIAAFKKMEDRWLTDDPIKHRDRKSMRWEPIEGGKFKPVWGSTH